MHLWCPHERGILDLDLLLIFADQNAKVELSQSRSFFRDVINEPPLNIVFPSTIEHRLVETELESNLNSLLKIFQDLIISWKSYHSVEKFMFLPENLGSSRWQMFLKIGVLKNFANFTGKHLCWSLFLIETPTQVFSCKICEIFKNFFLQNTSGCFWKHINEDRTTPYSNVLHLPYQ